MAAVVDGFQQVPPANLVSGGKISTQRLLFALDCLNIVECTLEPRPRAEAVLASHRQLGVG